jgi:hypothetical protein
VLLPDAGHVSLRALTRNVSVALAACVWLLVTDDLGNVMKANQVVNKKLQETVHDRDDRASHLERALTQLAYAEQVCAPPPLRTTARRH